MATMQTELTAIAAKVRGVAAENNASQERVAAILGISRQAVSQRMTARVPYAAHEILRLAVAFREPIERFYPAMDRVSTKTSRTAAPASDFPQSDAGAVLRSA